MRTREYGVSGPQVLVLHGGPGAPGYMEPVAYELAHSYRVLEPFQRGSGGAPLRVARHVSDLQELLQARCHKTPAAVVGHSWGAMLALAHAAVHPEQVAALVLIGCGTFDEATRTRMQEIHEERIDDSLRRRMQQLEEQYPDPDEHLSALGSLHLRLYSYDLLPTDQALENCDARAHQETWDDMLRLQEEGVYPEAFATIKAPVIMLHGDVDPHPGEMIRASLEPHLPQLEYREWQRCGHYPWLEKAARDEFFAFLHEWLARQLTAGSPAKDAGPLDIPGD